MTDGEVRAGDPGPTDQAARDFRASLDHWRAAEEVMAEAQAVRQRATHEAAEILRVAEALAVQIVAEARQRAGRIAGAGSPSEHIGVAIDRLESMASDVQMVLDGALAEVAASLAALVPRDEKGP